ncbi:hypothetical protein K502DRAFT_368442 [Neoconidiobolus thromboides FSU 785]|nr:hypothetical protein K502DRAFT_368442 [Neoconidiobolus thromboides FSU 785]
MEFMTLDLSIYKFTVRRVLTPHSILQINRKISRDRGIDVNHLADLVEGINIAAGNLNTLEALDNKPITLLRKGYHPNVTSCNYMLSNRLILVFKVTCRCYLFRL